MRRFDFFINSAVNYINLQTMIDLSNNNRKKRRYMPIILSTTTIMTTKDHGHVSQCLASKTTATNAPTISVKPNDLEITPILRLTSRRVATNVSVYAISEEDDTSESHSRFRRQKSFGIAICVTSSNHKR